MSKKGQVKACSDGLAVIHVSLFRMGTKSFTEAYRALGYKVHHGDEDVLGNPWELLEQASEATWPRIPGARPRARFTRADWDELFGNEYDIATDMACPFVDQLIEAYPDAKIVVVQRDFESWWKSYQTAVLDSLFPLNMQFIVFLLGYIIRTRAAYAMKKMNYGLFNARNYQEVKENARETYDAYYRKIRVMVPEEKRLEYRIGDGWEPLCAFLDKDVPDLPFPRINDEKYRREKQKRGQNGVYLQSLRRVGVWVLGAAATWSFVRYVTS